MFSLALKGKTDVATDVFLFKIFSWYFHDYDVTPEYSTDVREPRLIINCQLIINKLGYSRP